MGILSIQKMQYFVQKTIKCGHAFLTNNNAIAKDILYGEGEGDIHELPVLVSLMSTAFFGSLRCCEVFFLFSCFSFCVQFPFVPGIFSKL